jgi:Mrp family chromosome partitioning ATPase
MPETHGPLRPGLSNYLVGAAGLEESIHRTGLPNIYIVPSGPPPPSLAGLLESPRGRTAVEDLTAHAERVIVDCPPLTVGANAAMLSGQVDAVILVVDLERSTETAIRDALRQLESVKANVVGFVLNRDKSAGPSGSAYDYFTDPSARRERAAARS